MRDDTFRVGILAIFVLWCGGADRDVLGPTTLLLHVSLSVSHRCVYVSILQMTGGPAAYTGHQAVSDADGIMAEIYIRRHDLKSCLLLDPTVGKTVLYSFMR